MVPSAETTVVESELSHGLSGAPGRHNQTVFADAGGAANDDEVDGLLRTGDDDEPDELEHAALTIVITVARTTNGRRDLIGAVCPYAGIPVATARRGAITGF